MRRRRRDDFSFRHASGLTKRLFDGAVQVFQTCLDIFAEVSTESAASTLLQYAQIAGSLGIDDHTKGIFLIRNGKVLRMVGRDLKKYAGVGSALVILAGGVKKARAKTEAGCDFLVVANSVAETLQGFFVLAIALDEP